MPYLHAELQPSHDGLTADDLAARVVQSISGARIVSRDWYADRRKETEDVIKRLRAAGNPVPHGQVIVDSVDRAKASNGPAITIELPLSERIILRGRISLELVLLFSDDPIDQFKVTPVIEAFRSLGILKSFRIHNS